MMARWRGPAHVRTAWRGSLYETYLPCGRTFLSVLVSARPTIFIGCRADDRWLVAVAGCWPFMYVVGPATAEMPRSQAMLRFGRVGVCLSARPRAPAPSLTWHGIFLAACRLLFTSFGPPEPHRGDPCILACRIWSSYIKMMQNAAPALACGPAPGSRASNCGEASLLQRASPRARPVLNYDMLFCPGGGGLGVLVGLICPVVVIITM